MTKRTEYHSLAHLVESMEQGKIHGKYSVNYLAERISSKSKLTNYNTLRKVSETYNRSDIRCQKGSNYERCCDLLDLIAGKRVEDVTSFADDLWLQYNGNSGSDDSKSNLERFYGGLDIHTLPSTLGDLETRIDIYKARKNDYENRLKEIEIEKENDLRSKEGGLPIKSNIQEENLQEELGKEFSYMGKVEQFNEVIHFAEKMKKEIQSRKNRVEPRTSGERVEVSEKPRKSFLKRVFSVFSMSS